MRNRDDRDLLKYMLKEIEDIEDFVSGVSENEFAKNIEKQKAVCLSFQNIGNYAHRLSEQFVEEYHTIPWSAVYGFRTMVAHEYHNVDMDRVWLMVEDDVPQLKELILAAL